MMTWFRQLERRERIVLGAGAALAVVIIGWRFVFMPLDARSEALDQEVGELTGLLVDLRRAAALRDTGAATRSQSGDVGLLALVDQTAQPLGLASTFDRTRLEGPDAIYVSFRNAPFDRLNTWLMDLELSHGVTVMSVSGISATGTPGLVNGQILLARS